MKKLKCVAAVLCAGVLAASLCLAGCGDDETQRGPVTDEQGNVVVEVDKNISTTLVVAYKNENKELEMIKHLEALFQKEYPNVKFSNQAYTGSTSIVIDRNISAGEAPDIFMTNSFDMFSLDDKDLLLDFAPYMQREQELGTFDMGEYYETYFKLGQRDFNGAQLLVPRSVDRVVVHYNKEIIRRAEEETGQEIQKYIKNGWTWDDFDTVCAALKQSSLYQNSNIVDFNMDWEAVYNPILQYYGVKYFENDELAFDSEAGRQALDFFKNWAEKGYAPRSKDKAADFDYGVGAMHFQSRAVSETIKNLHNRAYTEKPLDSDWSDIVDVVTMPVFADKPLIGAGAAGYCAYKDTENPALVWQFLKHIISREGQNAIADTGNNLVPVRKDMADYKNPDNHWGKGYENLNLTAYTYNIGGEGEENWNCYTDYFLAASPRFAVAMNDAFGLMIQGYAGGTTYEASMTQLKAQIARILRSS